MDGVWVGRNLCVGTIFDQCKERDGRAEKKAGQVVFMWRMGRRGLDGSERRQVGG